HLTLIVKLKQIFPEKLSLNSDWMIGMLFQEHVVLDADADLYIQQAVVFIEDAIQYRSINHRVDSGSLRLYRWYYSKICQWGLGFTIAVVLALAFIETPSSLTYTSDIRFKPKPWEPPCGLTEGIEMVCLCIFILDFTVKSYLIGWEEFRMNKWLIGYIVVIAASVIDWMLSVSMVCNENLRVRRLIRPFFLLQNSSLMKKTLKCIKRTLPEIKNGEWETYFKNLPKSLSSLLVLLTTANNPDGTHIDCSVFVLSLQHPPKPEYSSPVLQHIQYMYSHFYIVVLGNVVALANVICICTVLVLNSEKSASEKNNFYMEILNCIFILYYLIEMLLKIVAFGWRGYLSYRNNIFDGFFTVLLLVTFARDPVPGRVMPLWEMVRLVNMLIVFRFLRIIPEIKLMAVVASTLVDLVKNLRAFAGILLVKTFLIIFIVFTSEPRLSLCSPFSLISNSSIENKTDGPFSMDCGTFEQLEYWPNNFDDFASSLVLLYNIMVVNNWHVFTDAYTRYTTEWSLVYFVAWWLTSSVMWVNLFVALILENFTYKWDRSNALSVEDVERIAYQSTVQLIFRYD
uniref:Two pore segment channel 2 n=1 Tax=Cyprinus carpio carpio TaxID=630221 RepID=A0A9J8ARR9_CYPCA